MNYEERDTYGMYKIGSNGAPHADGHHGPGPRLMGADTLNGNDVFNEKDEDLGDIKEFMLDMKSGRVSYAVLSFGGFLGMGDKLFAVPWDALKLDTVNKRFVLNVDKADRKIALSHKALQAAIEKEDMKGYMGGQNESFSSLGELFKGELNKNNNNS